MLIRVHKNLGHPSNHRLATALREAGHRPELVQAATELKCTVCQHHAIPKHQRPATLKENMDFNHKIYIDKITWSNRNGKSFHWYHMLDAGSNFHVAIAKPIGTSKEVIQILEQHWLSWAVAHLIKSCLMPDQSL